MKRSDIKSYRTNTCSCLSCGAKLSAATSVLHKRKPQSGAITICAMCGYMMAFDDDLKFRELNSQEMYAVEGNPTILALQKLRHAAWAKVRAERERTQ